MRVLLIFFVLLFSSHLFAGGIDCTNWPKNMAFVHLKNEGLIDSKLVNDDKTEVKQLASEKLGTDLYREIYLIKYIEKSGNEIEVITINDTSSEECSMSDVEVFLITKKL
jgi:hypothetical protein